jgi:hypothetical protein
VKNTAPFFIAISINFLISLLLIIYLRPSWFEIYNVLSYSPIAACILWISVPFLLSDFSKKTMKLFDGIKGDQKSIANILGLGVADFILTCIEICIFVILVVLLILLPFFALWVIYPHIETPDIFLPKVFLVTVFQVIIILLLTSYFSALSAKKELSNSITNFAILNSLVNYFIIRKITSDEKVEKIKKSFFSAKLYDIKVDDSLLFIYVYQLIPNQMNVQEIISESENKNENVASELEKKV